MCFFCGGREQAAQGHSHETTHLQHDGHNAENALCVRSVIATCGAVKVNGDCVRKLSGDEAHKLSGDTEGEYHYAVLIRPYSVTPLQGNE